MIGTKRIGMHGYYAAYLSEIVEHGERPYNVWRWKDQLWVSHDEAVQGFRLPTWMTMV